MTTGSKRERSILGLGVSRSEVDRAGAADDDDDEAPSVYESWVGRIIDERYAIDEVLAEGGMGAVFIATHVKLGRRVAVKVMHPDLEGDDEIAQRFEREVEVTGRLQHRHIVAALDCGTMADGAVYLVLELVTGRSLAEAIYEDGPFDWMRAAEVGAEIADALSAAHDEGIVHRDLKPDNVVLEPDEDVDETVKLLDFGIAHVAKPDARRGEKLTLAGAVLGTVGYMAPEQCMGQPVDGRADLYTLGVLLWEMLAGRTLFDEELTPSEFVKAQIIETPPSIADIVPDVPPPLAAKISALLAYEKKDRPADAREVRDALRALSAEAPAAAVVIDADTGSMDGIEAADAAIDPAVSSVDHEPRAPVRRRVGAARWVTVGVACVAAIGFVAWAFGAIDELGAPATEAAGGVGPIAPGPVAGPREDPIEASLAVLLAEDAEALDRDEAAVAILRHEPRDEVPPIAVALAQLETSSDCDVRVRAVRSLAELGDPRAVEPLRRHGQATRPRCGRRFVRQIGRVTRRLERAASEPP